MLYILYWLENTKHVNCRAFIYCDNLKATKGALNKSPIDIKTATGNDADIMMKFKDILPQIQLPPKWPGSRSLHRTRGAHHYKLNQITLNATVGFLKTPPKEHTPLYYPLQFPLHRVSIYHNNELITSGLKSLFHQKYYPPIVEKLKKNNKWTSATFDSIDWNSFRCAMTSLGPCEWVSICKLTNGLWNTSCQSQRYYGKSPDCPYCSLGSGCWTSWLQQKVCVWGFCDRISLWRGAVMSLLD
jgi:hypothetical protein